VSSGLRGVAALVAAIAPSDDTERAQRADALTWLASTPDVYRRVKPATPPRHLVSYAVLTDQQDGSMFLVDHRLAGLWLPAGGHVEPGEEPSVTAEREAREELGIEADFSIAGRRPVFVAVTRTRGSDTHTDVTLWYLLAGSPALPITLDPREFADGPQLDSAAPALFDPNMGRFLAKIRDQPRA
jgi:8-oxo-dGTP pyrophosphatase MutT (NUDIX family)